VKIVAIVRTLNEERNIKNCCINLAFCDQILIADGGSEDNTIELATGFSNVRVRLFTQRIKRGDQMANPEPAHLNFLVDWAVEEGAAWIIYDDCDSHPTIKLQEDARRIMDANISKYDSVHVQRVYLRGRDRHFPKAQQGPNLWAWQPDKFKMQVRDGKDFFETVIPGPNNALKLDYPPYALLHNFYPNEESYQQKLERYAAWGHPQEHIEQGCYGPSEELPDWLSYILIMGNYLI
jgi:hypothetical protein